MTYEQAKQELIRAGYKVSSGSWKDHDSDWFVFSQEGAGPDTYGSPMARIRNDNGRITKDIPKHPGTNYKWSASLRDRIALAAVKRELGIVSPSRISELAQIAVRRGASLEDVDYLVEQIRETGFKDSDDYRALLKLAGLAH